MEGGRAGCWKPRESWRDFNPRPAPGLNCYTIFEYSETSFSKVGLMCTREQPQWVCECLPGWVRWCQSEQFLLAFSSVVSLGIHALALKHAGEKITRPYWTHSCCPLIAQTNHTGGTWTHTYTTMLSRASKLQQKPQSYMPEREQSFLNSPTTATHRSLPPPPPPQSVTPLIPRLWAFETAGLRWAFRA